MEVSKIDEARAELAALDLNAERAQIAEIDAGLADIDTALASARSQVTDLDRRISVRNAAGPDKDAAAAALLAGTSVAEATPSAELLREERASIIAGISGLSQRRSDLHSRRDALKGEMAHKVARPLETIVDDLRASATTLVRQIFDLQATVAAIADVGSSREARELANELAEVTRATPRGLSTVSVGSVFPDMADLIGAARAMRVGPAPEAKEPAHITVRPSMPAGGYRTTNL